MSIIHARIRIAPDGTITGLAPGAKPGEHAVAIILQGPRSPGSQDEVISAIRAFQEAVARPPILDQCPVDGITGYDENRRFGR